MKPCDGFREQGNAFQYRSNCLDDFIFKAHRKTAERPQLQAMRFPYKACRAAVDALERDDMV